MLTSSEAVMTLDYRLIVIDCFCFFIFILALYKCSTFRLISSPLFPTESMFFYSPLWGRSGNLALATF